MQILPVWHRRGDCYNGSAVNRSHNMSHLFLGQMVCGRAFQDSPTVTGPKAEAIDNSALLLCKRWAQHTVGGLVQPVLLASWLGSLSNDLLVLRTAVTVVIIKLKKIPKTV